VARVVRNNRDPGTVPTKEALSLLKSRFPNMSLRIVLGISAAALSLSLAHAPAAFGQDSMQIDLDFKSGRLSDDGIRKDTISKPPFGEEGARAARGHGRRVFRHRRGLPSRS
jgi:pentapeptide MXKDX repeat protein